MAIFFIVSSVSWQALGAVDCSLVTHNTNLSYNLEHKEEAANCCRALCGYGLDDSGVCCCLGGCGGAIENPAPEPTEPTIDCQKVYNNVDLEYNLNNKPASAKCCVSMCGGVGGIDDTGTCCCSPECAGDEPSEPQNCDTVAMCCFDELEYYDKYPECCELNDKFVYVASYYGDTGDNSDKGDNPNKFKPECCIKDAPKNTQGRVTQTCCKFYGGRESRCHFYEDDKLNESACCAKESRRLCDNSSEGGYKGAVSFICCYAEQGVVVVKGKRIHKEQLYKYKNIEQDRNAWVCCKTFGYTGAGSTDCTPREGVTSDFDDGDKIG